MKKDKKLINMKAYKRKKKNNNRRKIIYPILILVIIILNISGQVVVSNLNTQVQSLEESLNKEQIKLEQAQANLYNSESIQNIEEIAKDELNMEYLRDAQIVYIDTEK